MTMTMVSPSRCLAPFVRTFMVVEVRDAATRVRLPEQGLVLGVRYQGCASVLAGDAVARLPDFSLAGLTDAARRMHTTAGGGVVLAMFHPAGAAQFFAEPLHGLFGATVALDQLVPHGEVDRVASQVVGAASSVERIAALEAFLLARLRAQSPDPLVAAAVRAIHESRGAIRIGALARALATSRDPLEKRFRRVVGTSPKQFASLWRIRCAMGAWRPGMSLGQLALDAGYFDQSHFNREFRAVTGEAPGRFLRTGEHD